ncbi:MAG: transposase [Pirellulaceae bacterium]
MGRPLRMEFSGAIYHTMSRGNARQRIFYDDRDYQRLCEGLERTVDRFGFEIFSFVCMPNHFHLLFRTPKPNLSRGMQYLLSGYANWFSKRHQRPGHLFQGRFKGELIEDDSYFWVASRYLHLNPVRGKHPLVTHPRDWPWSSYPGYDRRSKRLNWVAYDQLYQAWQGEMGGANVEAAYRRFVEAGLADPPANPFQDAVHGWLMGSEQFVDRIKELMEEPTYQDEVPTARRLANLSVEAVIAAVAGYYGTTPVAYRGRRSKAAGRDVAAWLARRLTSATLRDLMVHFGLGHPDSVSNLVRRADKAVGTSKSLRQDVEAIRTDLAKTENRV